MNARDLSPEELATVARFEQAPDALGPCTCAHYGNASRCPHHTQEDYDLAEAAREAPDALGLREEVAEVLREFVGRWGDRVYEWHPDEAEAYRSNGGFIEGMAAAERVRTERAADALLPLIERREAEAAERAWDEGAWATAERWDIAPARRNPYRADRIGGPQ